MLHYVRNVGSRDVFCAAAACRCVTCQRPDDQSRIHLKGTPILNAIMNIVVSHSPG